MQWASVLHDDPASELAARAAAEAVKDRLDRAPDVVFAFASPQHREQMAAIPDWVRETFPGVPVVGCLGGGILGDGREHERQSALTLVGATLPDVELKTHHLSDDLPEDPAGWHARLGFDASEPVSFLLLPDPFTFDAAACLAGLDGAYPEAVTVGGIASGANSPGGHTLYCGDTIHRRGAVLVSLRGDLRLDPVICQGCKPIGEPMLVSSCDRNVILGLDQKKPGEVVRALFATLDDEDRKLFRTSLFLGIEMRDQVEYEAGDFLIRNLVGLSPDGDALSVGGVIERWKAVQFHLRDQATSAADLKRQLQRYLDGGPSSPPAGALLFSCLGRGEYLYGRPGHDSDVFRELVGDVPLGGFFCNGEIGPVGGRTFTHGYTSAFALFHPRG